MVPKNNPDHHKTILVLSQISILFLAMAALFWLMVAGNKERIENDLRTRLDAAAGAMAAQLKVNQVPFSATNVEPGVFIVNQTDGTLAVDRRNYGDAGQKLWDGYKTKIIYEMQKQKRGWIEYPDKNSWDFNQPQRIIRYVPIDELNWILALEDKKPSTMDLLKGSVDPSACLAIFVIFILGAVSIWLLNMQYFDLIKRHISRSLEDNLLSLNGEEKLWSKSHGAIPKMNESQKDQGLGFSTAKIGAASAGPMPVDDPIMEEVFQKAPTTKPISPKPDKNEQPKIEIPKEILKAPLVRPAEHSDMAVDVQHINSPILKKILKQFREK